MEKWTDIFKKWWFWVVTGITVVIVILSIVLPLVFIYGGGDETPGDGNETDTGVDALLVKNLDLNENDLPPFEYQIIKEASIHGTLTIGLFNEDETLLKLDDVSDIGIKNIPMIAIHISFSDVYYVYADKDQENYDFSVSVEKVSWEWIFFGNSPHYYINHFTENLKVLDMQNPNNFLLRPKYKVSINVIDYDHSWGKISYINYDTAYDPGTITFYYSIMVHDENSAWNFPPINEYVDFDYLYTIFM